MAYHWLANLVLVLHLAFVLFVVAGGFLVLRWPRLGWLHLPAAIWGVLIELTGSICPLTPLEVSLRRAGGGAGYEGGFVEHYVTTILYPSGLTRGIQITLGLVVLALNAAIYWAVLRRTRPR